MSENSTFEETCPCGASIKLGGLTIMEMRLRIDVWHGMHNKHSNAIAKAIVENKAKTPYYVWPQSTWVTGGGGGAARQEE